MTSPLAWCSQCGAHRIVDCNGHSVHCQQLDCAIGNLPARARWKCDLDPECHDQGCGSNPDTCPRVRDLRAGIDRRPHDRPRKMVHTYNPSAVLGRWFRKLFERGC